MLILHSIQPRDLGMVYFIKNYPCSTCVSMTCIVHLSCLIYISDIVYGAPQSQVSVRTYMQPSTEVDK